MIAFSNERPLHGLTSPARLFLAAATMPAETIALSSHLLKNALAANKKGTSDEASIFTAFKIIVFILCAVIAFGLFMGFIPTLLDLFGLSECLKDDKVTIAVCALKRLVS